MINQRWSPKGLLISGLVSSTLGLSVSAFAAGELEEIIVTAQKQAQNIQKIPISIKAISAGTLEEINADSLDDIVRLVPSLSMTDLSRGGSNVQIRGLGSNVGNVGTVALYNDGVISVNRIQSSGTFSEQDSALYDVGRVEVLRGPQGTLWGEGSFGGTINIISKRPDPTQLSASLSGTYSKTEGASDDTKDIAGMINIPLIKDQLAARVVGFSYDRAGYIDAIDVLPVFAGAAPTLVGEDLDTEEVTGGRILLGWTPGDMFDATLIYKTQDTKLGTSHYDSPGLVALANTIGGTSFQPEFTQAAFGPEYGANNTTDEVVLDINYETPIGSLASVTGWGETAVDSAAGLDAKSEAFSQELHLASDNPGALNWIVGAYYRSAKRDVSVSGNPFNVNENDQWSLFGQGYYKLSPTLTLTAGLRYGEQEATSTDLLNGLPGVSETFDDVSPKLALDWQASDDMLLYGSVAKGFRAGGTNVDESLGTDPLFSAGFDPDEIWNYEIGIKSSFYENRMTLNAAVFYIDWIDIQIDAAIASVVTPPLQFIVVNGKSAHSTGIEVDFSYVPAEGWYIVLGGSLVEAEFDGGAIDTANGLGQSLDGERLASSPEYLFNASVEKNFPFGAGYEAYGRVDYSVRGNSFGDVPNTAPPGGDFKSGQYSSVNLRFGVRHDIWEAQLFATNLTDEYASSYNFYDGGFGSVHTVIQPRTIGLNLKLRLGQ